jgi:tRNA (cmo5U34)-methyltransferase
VTKRDTIFAVPREESVAFEFNETVAEVFDDMVTRSVPLYQEVQYLIAELAGRFIEDGGVIYDLGCSTGTTILHLARRWPDRNIQFVALDSSAPMIERASVKLTQAGLSDRVVWRQDDLNEPLAFGPADVFIMNLTLQFVRPANRARLVSQIHTSLRSGGCLILVEKVLPDNLDLAPLYTEIYYDHKRRQGYSELEIAQKRAALENRLIPYAVRENLDLLCRNGFSQPDIFFRWCNFAGFIGIR